MGILLAVVVATLFSTYLENKKLLPIFTKQIIEHIRFIDNGLILQIIGSTQHNSLHKAFKKFKSFKNYLSNLNLKVLLLNTTINFLDLALTITKDYELIITPYTKLFHLYQHIPLNSAYPSSILKSVKGIFYVLQLQYTHTLIYQEKV